MYRTRELPGRIEGPNEYIAIKRASELSGSAAGTPRNRALAEKLTATKRAHDLLTTRWWLHTQQLDAGARWRGPPKPRPAGYESPE